MAEGIKKIILKSGKIKWQIRPWANGEQLCKRFDLRSDAKKRLREIEIQIEQKTFTRPREVPTVEEGCKFFIAAKQLEAKRQGGAREESTLDYYRNHINKFIIPSLGACQMNEIDLNRCKEVRDQWASHVAPETANKMITTARGIWKEQMSVTISSNPWTAVKLLARSDNKARIEVVEPDEIYSMAEVDRIITATQHDQARYMLRLAAESGLRVGELCGLREIDIQGQTVSVKQQWKGGKKSYDQTGKPIFMPPKNRSMREVRISKELALALAKFKLANVISDYGLIFSTNSGGPVSRKAVWEDLNRSVERANSDGGPEIQKRSPHSLRHHFASILIARKVPVSEVASLLGHRNSQVTMTVYVHLLKTESTYDPDKIFSAKAGK